MSQIEVLGLYVVLFGVAFVIYAFALRESRVAFVFWLFFAAVPVLMFLFLIAAFISEIIHGSAQGPGAPLAGEAGAIVIVGILLSAGLGWVALRYAPTSPDALRRSIVIPTLIGYSAALLALAWWFANRPGSQPLTRTETKFAPVPPSAQVSAPAPFPAQLIRIRSSGRAVRIRA